MKGTSEEILDSQIGSSKIKKLLRKIQPSQMNPLRMMEVELFALCTPLFLGLEGSHLRHISFLFHFWVNLAQVGISILGCWE